MIWPYDRKRLWTKISSILTATSNLSQKTSLETLSAGFAPHIVLFIHRSTLRFICISKFPSFTTVQKNRSHTRLVNFATLLQRQTLLPTKTPPNSLNFSQALPIFALTALDAPPYELTWHQKFSTASKTPSPLLNSTFFFTEQLWPRQVLQTKTF